MLAVSGDESGADLPFRDWLTALERYGVDAMEVRDKEASDRYLFELASLARTIARQVKLLVNRRADIALAAGADGVHLPHDGFPIERLRGTFPSDWLYGRSTHSPEEVEAARREGADYAVFGPVFPTPSKPGAVDRPRLSELAEACTLGIPVLAIGGVALENLEAIAKTGARGVAAIRYFSDPGKLGEHVQAVRDTFSR